MRRLTRLCGQPGRRTTLLALLVCCCIAGVTTLVSIADAGQRQLVGYFTSAVGIYPGDDVKVAGVRVGEIRSITPQKGLVKFVMAIKPATKIPEDARALVVSPNLVDARFVQLAPTYLSGPTLPAGQELGTDRTGVPVEWDEVKTELTRLSATLGPSRDTVQGPLTSAVNQAAETFDGNGESFRKALRSLAQATGRLSDSRTDVFGTVRNLGALVDALSQTNVQVVEFSGRLASVSRVLADSTTDLDSSLAALNQALGDVRTLLKDNNSALVGGINKAGELTKLINDQSDDVEQVLHVAPNGLVNFYNGYNPAQGTISGQLQFPNFANPVQFICGSMESAGTPDMFKRTEICRERMAPVLRRLTMNYAPALFHPINSINAYKGQILYDTPATEAKAKAPIADLQWVPAPGSTAPPTDPETLSGLLLPPVLPPGPVPPAPGQGGGR